MSDGRVLIGVFLCTDRDSNIILGSCSEYLPEELQAVQCVEEPRMLGLVMVPGKHLMSVSIDANDMNDTEDSEQRLSEPLDANQISQEETL